MRSAPLLVALLLCGCARTSSLAPVETRAEVNRRAEDQTVTVALRSGERVEARALRVDADSASWLGPGDLRLRRVAASDIAAVSSWQLPHERGGAPLHCFTATAAGRQALLGGGAEPGAHRAA